MLVVSHQLLNFLLYGVIKPGEFEKFCYFNLKVLIAEASWVSDAQLIATEKIVDTKGSYFCLFHVSLVCKNVENL